MANTIDVSNLTQKVIEAPAINLPLALAQDLGLSNQIITTMENNQKIVSASPFGSVGIKGSGCGNRVRSAGTTLSEKKINYGLVVSGFEQCALDLQSYANLMSNTDGDVYKLCQNTVYKEKTGLNNAGILMHDLALQTIMPTLSRTAWFGDSEAKLVSDGGVYANAIGAGATGLLLFTAINNGLWKQTFKGVADGKIARVTIATNAGVTKVAQATYPEDWASKILWAMYDAITPELDEEVSAGRAKFLVTRDIYKNYLKFVEGKNASGGFTDTLENGKPKLMFQGIELIDMNQIWSPSLKLQDNGTVFNLPNRAVLSSPQNLPIFEIPAAGKNSEIKLWYDDKDEKNYADLSMQVDALIIDEARMVVAY